MPDGCAKMSTIEDAGRTETLLRYAARATPRYTSYPTAPHFKKDVGEASYRQWLSKLDPSEPISLYLHVPFCKQLCWYCGCNMKLAARYAPVAAYVETLLREVELLADALPERMTVSHLHWGGGTPTTLSPEDLGRVMAAVESRFDYVPGAERAIEVDPRGLSNDMIDALGALGFNRVSFGVQEFDPAVQNAINRIQTPELVADCVRRLRAVGVQAVNFDLIYGLPLQTTEMLKRTAKLSIEMGPDRVALFGYAHVPWMAKKQRLINQMDLPDIRQRIEMAECAARVFSDAGYQAIGVDHFAKPDDALAAAAKSGRLRRNFQGYTDDAAAALLGLGASSIGRTPAGYVQNIVETGAWRDSVREGRLPIAKGRELAGEDWLRGRVIERLMCDGAVDLEAEAEALGADADWWRGASAPLQALATEGVVSLHGARVELTALGSPLRRIVASVFDAYLADGGARHSKSI